ncbi:hypothetical protein PFICI_12793 [Pestalotiopsis fici W106-1]|uniref:Uncharacterized protein n=1 Tax=Pestalotiopsis fici (strain W106-1 / CGMCC3.15140) TaxID=1229662 RepID=W3WPY2_PESFW|nr:uncharacterized protein PFICI_12793 [Pestalotiopsis fici W106-1]ETS75849.1 hypothetical protein PFICI_12793 [Pestalotiopsis fici W106-1]
MTVVDRVCDAAVRNHALLAILSETENAVESLSRQKTRVAELDTSLSKLRQDIQHLDEKRKSDLKRHKSYRDSVVKKLAYRLSGQSDEFSLRKEKEESEYLQALQKERLAKEEESRLLVERQEALQVQQSLQDVVERRKEAQNEIEMLYDSIFSGPTPEFPEEDELESKAAIALNVYHCAAVKDESNRKIVRILTEARQLATKGVADIVAALEGGQMASTASVRRRLGNADQALKKMQSLVRGLSPAFQTLPAVNIRLQLIDDRVSDNPWSMTVFRDKIRDWRAEAQACVDELDKHLSTARSKSDQSHQSMIAKSQDLVEARTTLQSCRTEIFAIIESAEDHAREGESPPPY